MRAVLTFAIVCTFSFPALADEQREVTAALKKAIETKKKSLPGEIEKAKQRLKGISDDARKEAAAQDLTALEELQKKLEKLLPLPKQPPKKE